MRRKYYPSIDAVLNAYVNQLSSNGRNSTESLFFEGDVLYSYGYHFPLAVRLDDGFYIVNGDKYSVTTSCHQSALFSIIPNSRRVEIPYSALLGAFGITSRGLEGIEKDVKKIRVIDWQNDTWIPTNRFDKNGERIYEHVLGGSLFEYEGRRFLSGMDESGVRNGLFFLTELVDNEVETVADAFESLKPEQVKQAEAEGKKVLRQGEWFFVEVGDLDTGLKVEVQKQYVLKGRRADREDHHVVTEGIEIDGRQFVRGVVKHSRGEHRMLKLYEPGVKRKDRPWFEAFENVQVNSWSASGNVD